MGQQSLESGVELEKWAPDWFMCILFGLIGRDFVEHIFSLVDLHSWV